MSSATGPASENSPEAPAEYVIERFDTSVPDGAVEIAKLRLWLSIIAEVDADEIDEYDEDDLALPNVVFNVQQGNSLVGYTDLMETTADGKHRRVDSWGSNTVREKYEDVIEQMRLHKEAEDTETAREHLVSRTSARGVSS